MIRVASCACSADRGTRGRALGVLAEEPDGEVGESGAWRLRGRSPWGYGAYPLVI